MQRQVHRLSRLIGASTARYAIAASILALASCGGDSNGPPLNLSGTVSGLTTSGLSLTTLGVNLVVSSGATSFSFGPILANGVVYDVTVPDQPTGQICTVTNGSGTATTADITNVVVTCSNKTFQVGGTISGLTSAGLVLANGSDTLDVPAGSTSFTMPTAVAYGSAYKVTVTSQPSGLTCDVADGSGTIAGIVTNIAITCSDTPLTVGGSVRGLGHTEGLVLVNGSSSYTVPENAENFALATTGSPGSDYAVRVQSQPNGMTCTVSKGLGTLPSRSVDDVSITCAAEAYKLGGTVSGLSSVGLVLSDGTDSFTVPIDGTRFTMSTALADGSPYAVNVLAQPAGLTCTVNGGTGVIASNDVSSVSVTCASMGYTLGGSISGLKSSGLILTDGTDDLSVASNAAQFSMPNAVASGSDYAVTIKAQPSGETCQLTQGSGKVSGRIDTIQIVCATTDSL